MISTFRPTRHALLAAVFALASGMLAPLALASTCPPPVITSIFPASVPAAGNVPITIIGTNFTSGGSPKVTIGLRDVQVLNATNTMLVVMSPPQDDDAMPPVRVRAGKFKPQKLPLDRITYDAPVVDAAPTAILPRGGGLHLTITGSNFRCSTPGAYLQNPGTGETWPAQVVAADDTTIVIETRDCDDDDDGLLLRVTLGREGLVHRDLAARNILLSGSRAVSVSPPAVPACGGSTITIFGSGFDAGTGAPPRVEACVDGRCADVRVTSYTNTQVVAVAPPAPLPATAATAKLVVHANGVAGSSCALQYTAQPVLLGASSSSLPAAGGISLTLRGDNFGPNLLMRFDDGGGVPVDVPATGIGGGVVAGIVVGSAAPAMNVSLVQDGQASEPIALPVLPPPVVTSVSGGGPAGFVGGDVLTITGENFGVSPPHGHDVLVILDQNGQRRQVGPVRWSAPEVLHVRLPAMAVGGADVSVSVHGVPSASSAAITFASADSAGAPLLAGMTPAQAAPAGGTVITLTGSGFGASGTQVRFGTQLVTPGLLTNNFLTFVSPPFAPGEESAPVEVVTSAHKSSNPLYQDKRPPANNPLASSERASWAGGTTITLTGSDFEASARVECETGSGAVFRVVPSSVSPNELTFVAPELPAGSSVIARVVDGSRSSGAQPLPYSGPIVTSVIGGAMSPAGGTTITITGSGFGAVAGKGFFEKGDKPTQDSWSDHEIILTTSPRAPGCPNQRPFRVQTAAGDVSNAVSIAFLEPFVDGPDTPATSMLGGVPLTVRGSDFGPNAQLVWADGLPGPDITVTNRSATSFAILLGSGGGSGSRLMSLDPDSQSPPMPFALELLAPPSLGAVSPPIGPVTGGNVVTVTGANFGPPGTRRNVHFAGDDDCEFEVIEEAATYLVCQLPPGSSAGARDLVIEVEGVADTLPAAYEYSSTVSVDGGAVAAPRALALAPLRSPFAGEATLRLALPHAGRWQLVLHDVRGAQVRRFEGDADAGAFDLRWDGRAADGRSAAPGVYFARLSAHGATRDARLVKLR